MNRTALLDALQEAGRAGIRGSALAERFSVTRAAVWKEVEVLRREGLEISGGPQGYQLVNPAGWGTHTLSWRCRRPVSLYTACSSTNALARELARELPLGADPRSLPVVVTDHQTAGRGRRGRTWTAEAGANLLFSVVLQPLLPPDRVARAVLQWAAAMACVLDVGLKWPNDLVVAEEGAEAGALRLRKVGGILAELETSTEAFTAPGRVQAVVLGVGINVNQTTFDDLPDATSLANLGRPVVDRSALLGSLIQAIDAVDLRAPDGLRLWRERAVMLGQPVQAAGRTGIATGIRDDGALLVDGHPVLAGDVSLVGGDALSRDSRLD